MESASTSLNAVESLPNLKRKNNNDEPMLANAISLNTVESSPNPTKQNLKRKNNNDEPILANAISLSTVESSPNPKKPKKNDEPALATRYVLFPIQNLPVVPLSCGHMILFHFFVRSGSCTKKQKLLFGLLLN